MSALRSIRVIDPPPRFPVGPKHSGGPKKVQKKPERPESWEQRRRAYLTEKLAAQMEGEK